VRIYRELPSQVHEANGNLILRELRWRSFSMSPWRRGPSLLVVLCDFSYGSSDKWNEFVAEAPAFIEVNVSSLANSFLLCLLLRSILNYFNCCRRRCCLSDNGLRCRGHGGHILGSLDLLR